MAEKVLCPYCGAEMVVVTSIYFDSLGWGGRTLCKGCDAHSPRVIGYKTKAAAEEAALAAARARYLPPNRPLTLEEVKALPADDDGYIPGFLEIEPNWYAQVPDDGEPRLRADAICKEALGCNKGCETCNKGCETYNKLYRVWLSKPTQAEMDAAGWGDAE